LTSCTARTADVGHAAPRAPASAPKPPAAAPAAPPGPVIPDALFARAAQEYARGNPEGAKPLLEQTLAADPKHRQALALLAQLTQQQAEDSADPRRAALFLEAARAVRTLRDRHRDLSAQERQAIPVFIYNEACAYAQMGRTENALDSLTEAIASGFSDDELMARDPDLDSIRKSPRFGPLLQKVEATNRMYAHAAAKARLARMKPFAFRFELPNLERKKVTLGELNGSVLMVVLWGTWCPPCLRELPHVERLRATFRAQDLTVVGINYERGPEAGVAEKVKRFAAKQKLAFSCLIGDDRTRDQIPEFGGYPTILFLDGARRVRARVDGYASYVELEAIVRLLLDETTSVPVAAP
jgi:thiol-disulfide isomerase/thioredoxin